MKTSVLVFKLLGSQIIILLSILLNVATGGRWTSILTLVYSFFFTAFAEADSWLTRIVFTTLISAIVLGFYFVSKNVRILNIILWIIIFLSIPFFSMIGV